MSSRAFQGDISTKGMIRMRRLWSSGNLPLSLSLDVSVMLFPVYLTFSLCIFLSFFSLPLFYHDSPSVCGTTESALGSWCDEVMRRDVVIQQFQPKGHICSLSFAHSISVRIFSPSLFCSSCRYLSIFSVEYVLCTFCLSTSECITAQVSNRGDDFGLVIFWYDS